MRSGTERKTADGERRLEFGEVVADDYVMPSIANGHSVGGSGPMNSEVFLGRQQIVDAEREVFGYELLYRDGPEPMTAIDDPDAATRGVMERVFLRWGMEHVVGDRFGLINATAGLIVDGFHEAMPAEGVIIEIREDERLFSSEWGAACPDARR